MEKKYTSGEMLDRFAKEAHQVLLLHMEAMRKAAKADTPLYRRTKALADQLDPDGVED